MNGQVYFMSIDQEPCPQRGGAGGRSVASGAKPLNRLRRCSAGAASQCLKMNRTISKKKPLLKWVGGKSRLLDMLIKHFPKEINNYHEIFVGGGSVLLHYLSALEEGHFSLKGKIYAYDSNEPLIAFYKNIQSNHLLVYNEVLMLCKKYFSCGSTPEGGVFNDGKAVNRTPKNKVEAMQRKENYFYWVRLQYNELTDLEKKSIQGSAMFLFLNKTCFRGLFRLGPNGFNVPYGHYKNPTIVD